jgi:hypothetical protein
MTALQWIIKEAKILRKKSPKMEWKKAVAQASAIYSSKHKGKSPVGKKHPKKVVRKKAAKKKIGYSKVRYKQERGITKVLKSTPRTLFPYTSEEKLIKAGKKYYDNAAKGLSGTKRKVVRKKVTPKSLHKDTKSHNVNIRVMSGIKSYSMEALKHALNRIEYVQGNLDIINNHLKLKSPDKVHNKNLRNAKKINTEILRELKTHLKEIKKHIK